jgi:hypothetical protein
VTRQEFRIRTTVLNEKISSLSGSMGTTLRGLLQLVCVTNEVTSLPSAVSK